MPNTFFTSDLHLGHAGVIEFCNRPFTSVEHMDNEIIRMWNLTVMPTDTVYVLGDISFWKPSIGIPKLRSLAGNKILIQGNHDKYSRTQYLSAGFSVVAQEMVIKIGDKNVMLCHYPFWPKDADEEIAHNLRYQELRPKYYGRPLLCGHVHTAWKVGKHYPQINVGLDVWDYRPVWQQEIEWLLGPLFRDIGRDETKSL